MLLKITMLFAVTFVIYGFMSNATTSKYHYRKLQNDTEPWYCKKCVKNIVPFSQLSDNQIYNLMMLGSLMTSPKKSYKKTK